MTILNFSSSANETLSGTSYPIITSGQTPPAVALTFTQPNVTLGIDNVTGGQDTPGKP
jgi:hypothetical protein